MVEKKRIGWKKRRKKELKNIDNILNQFIKDKL